MKFKKLSSKLLLWYLVVALIPLIIFNSLGYFYAIQKLKKESINRLVEISEEKESNLEMYFKDKENTITMLAYNPVIISVMKEINEYSYEDTGIPLDDIPSIKKLTKYFEYYTHDQKTLYDMFLINEKGDVVFTVVKEDDYGTNLITGPYKDSQLAKTFKKAITLSAPKVSEFEYYSPSNEMAAFMGVPLWHKGELLGALCIQISTKDIFRIAQDYTDLGETGDTILGVKKGGQIKIIAPLRQESDAAFKKLIPFDFQKLQPIQLAAQAVNGIGLSIDYRCKDVLSVWKYVHHPGWGFVVKMDTDEIFASAGQYKQLMIIIDIVTIMVVVMISLFVSRSISKPISKLKDATKIVAKGDFIFDFKILSNDEIGQLAQSFKSMTSDLKVSNDKLKIRDKTVRKQMGNKLIEEKEKAERANKAKSEFLAQMSHELRTPLNSIIGFSQLIAMDKSKTLTDIQKGNVNRINKSGNQLLKLINEILDLSKIETENINLQIEPVDATELVNNSINSSMPFAEEKGIQIINGVTKGNDFFVMADRIKVEHVMTNLVSNAIKYNCDNGSVIISMQKADNNMLRFNVKDTGPGIDKKRHEDLFEPFNRLDAGKTEVKGIGLGLAISKKLITLMNGNIGVESVIGTGSCFYFELPISDSIENAGVISISKTDKKIIEKADDKSVILYIEDDPYNLEVVRQILEKRSHIDMISAHEALLGIELATLRQPDLILMDINLPGMDGLEAFKVLKNNTKTKDIPVGAISADAMQNDIDNAMEAGFNFYITKPIDINNFLETIDKFIVKEFPS